MASGFLLTAAAILYTLFYLLFHAEIGSTSFYTFTFFAVFFSWYFWKLSAKFGLV